MIREKENTICEGTVMTTKEWGIYVKLNDYLCEGLVSLSSLKKLGPCYFDKKQESIINKKTGNYFSLGDIISVKIEKIELNYGELDLSIA